MTFKKTGAYALAAGGMQQVLAMGHFLLVVRCLSPNDLGVWAMVLTLTSFVEMARLGLIQNALVHFSAHYPESRPLIFSTALALNITTSVILTAFFVAIAYCLRQIWQMPDLPMLLLLYLPTVVLLSLLRFFDGLRMLVHDFSIALWSGVSFGGMFLALTFLTQLNMHDMSPRILVLLQFPSAVFALGVVTLMGVTKSITWGYVSKEWLRRLIHFGRFGMGTNICSMIFQRADVLLLGAFVTPAALGAYNIATRIIGYLDFPLNNLGLALFPRLAAESKAGGTEGVILMYEKFVGWLLALTLPMTAVIVLSAHWIVYLIAGDRFPDAVLLVQIFALAGIVKPWGRLFGITLDAIGKPEWNFKILLASMVINIAFNAALIPLFGILGAATATSLAIILTIAIGQMRLRTTLPIRAARAWLYVVPTYRQALKLLH